MRKTITVDGRVKRVRDVLSCGPGERPHTYVLNGDTFNYDRVYLAGDHLGGQWSREVRGESRPVQVHAVPASQAKTVRKVRASMAPWATAGAACLVDRQAPGGPDYCGACDGSEAGGCHKHRGVEV